MRITHVPKLLLMKVLLGTVLLFVLLNIWNSKSDPDWHKSLPPCPCKNPDLNGVQLNDGWAKDQGDIATYHKGAAECFRSYPYIETSAGKSGQQCCYDRTGSLIQSGSGAGTPDKVSTCAGEDKDGVMKVRTFALLSHYFKDVKPWKNSGEPDVAWKVYNQGWPPSQVNCE